MALSYEFATENDGAEIAGLLENIDFKGEISLAYARRPNAVSSLAKDADKSVFVVARDDKENKIVGVGACAVKGRQAYLTGMRAERRTNIPKCYGLLREFCRENNVEVTYTTILADNIPVQKMLERNRPSMPTYLPYGECVTHIIRKNLKIKDDNMLCLIDGLYVLKDKNGNVLAQTQAVEQWDHKQYIVKRYGWKMRLAKKFFKWIPNENEPLKFFTLRHVWTQDAAALESLLRHISNIDKQGEFFLYGGIAAACPVKSIQYKSIVYIVDWEKKMTSAADVRLAFEIADL